MGGVKRSGGGGFKKLDKILTSTQKNLAAKVGWFEKDKYPNGTPVAMVARVQEFGNAAKNIPSRPYFRNAIAKNQSKWRKIVANLAQKIVKGTLTYEQALEQLGLVSLGDLKDSITQLIEPPLKDSTIKARIRKRKKGVLTKTIQKPLVDSGVLLNTATSIVEPK